MLQRMKTELALNSTILKNSIYNDSNKSMVLWCVIDSYFNIEQIQIGDIEI